MGGADGYQKLTPSENAALGVAAGTIEVTILQPMLYCKNATQQNLPFTMDPRILYRGLAVSIMNMSIATGLQFPLAGLASNVMTGGEDRKLSAFEQISAGFIGGGLSGVVCSPIELVLIQQQRFGGTVIGTPGRIISSLGMMTMSRGLTTICGREALFTAGYMGIGPSIKSLMEEKTGMSSANAKVVGAVGGGVIAGTLSHPLDTIKTCMQGDIEQKTYSTLTKTYKTLYEEGGPSRFFRGWTWRTGRMICAVFIMSECKTQLAPILFPHHF